LPLRLQSTPRVGGGSALVVRPLDHMKALLISVMLLGCFFGSAVSSFLVTTTAWSIQIEPRAFQCTDSCGWPFDNYWTDMDSHEIARDTISPGWTWGKLRAVRIIYIAAFFLLWLAGTVISFRMILSRLTRPNKSPEPTAVGAGRSAVAVHAASRRWLSFFR
jgi:hypothetical protein